MSTHPGTYIVVETGRLGDLIMTTPALQTLRKGDPDGRIIVVGSWPLAILEHHPYVDQLVRSAYPNPRWLRLQVERRRWKDWLADQNCHTILICHGHDHHIWEWAAGRQKGMSILSERLSRPEGEHHSERLHNLALTAVGGHGDAPPVRIVVTDSEREAAQQAVNALGRDESRPLVGVHIGSHRPSVRGSIAVSRKMWPLARWKLLVDELVRRRQAQMLFTGTSLEQELVQEVSASLPEDAKLDLSGKIDVRGFAATIALCGLFISADTGPMHIAAALGVPLVAMFSVTKSADTGPRGQGGFHALIELAAPCRGCHRTVRRQCRKSLCTDDITLERVLGAAEKYLACEVTNR